MVTPHTQTTPTEAAGGALATPSEHRRERPPERAPRRGRREAGQAPARRRGARAEGHPSGDERFAIIDKALTRGRYAQDHLIEVLHVAQDVFGYLSEDVLRYLARELRMPPSAVFGVATFYHLFSFDPPGTHACTVCTGTACFVKGADQIVERLQKAFSVAPGTTTADGSFTLSTARCLGSCGMAPVVVIDGEVRGYQDADTTLQAVEALLRDAPQDTGAEGGAVSRQMQET